ncbi:hypothetical protein ACLOJK_020936 [Asimina triloba]
MDRLIDMLKEADTNELQRLAVENVLAFNEGFWIRLAARTDTCKSDDDKKDYEELALTLMSIVDRLVHKTNEKIEFATDVLESILRPVVDEVEEITWPPRDPESLARMKKELDQRELEGQLDEGFLSEVNAQLRQAKEDGDKPGLQAMLQKVLQFYASKVLSKRSYAQKGILKKQTNLVLQDILQVKNTTKFNPRPLKERDTSLALSQNHRCCSFKKVCSPMPLLEDSLSGRLKKGQCPDSKETSSPEEDWNWLLINGLTLGKGEVSPEEFYAVIKKRIERTLIRTVRLASAVYDN